jgi:hypothetical protein
VTWIYLNIPLYGPQVQYPHSYHPESSKRIQQEILPTVLEFPLQVLPSYAGAFDWLKYAENIKTKYINADHRYDK